MSVRRAMARHPGPTTSRSADPRKRDSGGGNYQNPTAPERPVDADLESPQVPFVLSVLFKLTNRPQPGHFPTPAAPRPALGGCGVVCYS